MKKVLYSIFAAAVAILLVCCNANPLDINKDPYAVTQLSMNGLLSGAEYELGFLHSDNSYLGVNFPSVTHHTVSREANNYNYTASGAYVGNTWSQIYTYVMKNADELINNATEDPSYVLYGAIGKVIKAYTGVFAADLWGDVPFSQVNVAGVLQPVPDNSADIYNAAIAMVESARADFEGNANAINPGSADYYYAGDLNKWVRLCNTMVLKFLVQSRKASSQVNDWSSKLNALITADNFIANDEDFEFPHSTQDAGPDERKPGFVSEYSGSTKAVWISPWLYETMAGKHDRAAGYNFNDNPMADIVDPRLPYYYTNQIAEDGAAENNTDYRDGAFVSQLFASASGYGNASMNRSMSTIGIYAVGGRFENGQARPVTLSDGTGNVPERIVQAYSVPFMKAELILAGSITGDARAELRRGIEASIYHVNRVSQAAAPGSSPAAVITPTSQEVVAFIDAVLAAYDAGNAEKKMEIVMTQKWVASFYNTFESYNDIRRTGYPKLFSDVSGFGRSPMGHTTTPATTPVDVPISSIVDFPRIMYYPTREVSANANINNTERNSNLGAYGYVFWDVQ